MNQHCQRLSYPAATVGMSSIEVLHEMFMVSSDSARSRHEEHAGPDAALVRSRWAAARRVQRGPRRQSVSEAGGRRAMGIALESF